ncbi:MAG: hypothetical protein DIZ77_08785 [endosymbiont of Seepiophila jonesi]|uniref:Late control protein n=1 Tax=endosymbiont of Lamellibrachia luymesi TaxID=2200907 RepID=A0A370DZK0_9GAMM|nr:MAG: hypothetical protein DIZ79_04160 [endosymbiont of Lamellibrachia luymesi]RDH92299.1 MAG: hypothetical protein DIZ77_08785 [endosymbiont of Seepiophila jonesi]
MTPAYRIIADQQDITAIIRDRLISLHVTDKTGLVSDTAEITLDDRDSAIEIPRTGARLEIYMGYQETGLYRMGSYTVDEVELAGPPDTIRIRAKAADMRQSLKSCKLRNWDDITLGDLVATIAAEHGLIPRVGEFLDAIHIPHLDQTYESDMHLLTRLAKQYDADAKPVDGRLVFVEKGTAKSASGRPLNPIDINIEQVSTWRWTLAERGKYARVVAHYRDLQQAKDIYLHAGEGNPALCLRRSFPDKDTAKKAAHARLDKETRGMRTLSLTLIGTPTLTAEAKLTLHGFRKGVDDGWVATQASHEINGSGYSTRVEAETPKKT